MIEVKKIIVYSLHGVEYRSMDKIIDKVESNLGAIIDSFDVTLTPKQKLNILAGMVKNKSKLITNLSIEISLNDELQNDFKSVLDF